jgi:EmrB/QacA subfamily drug resistance transporter
VTESTVAAPPSPRGFAAVFVVTALAVFMASLDLSIVNIAFPALEHTFRSDPRSLITWVITAYAITFGALLVVSGRTADRIGARRVFFVGLIVFSIGSALCGVAPTLGLLIAGRVLQGTGGAAMLPASLGLLLAVVPLQRRTQAVALWSGVGALAVATGPTVGALLVTSGGWRWVFFVNLPIGAGALASGRIVLPRSSGDASHAPPDYLGAASVCAALALLVLGVTEGTTWGWTSVGVLASFAGSVALGIAFVRRCAHHRAPVLDLELFRTRTFSVANAAMVLYAMGFFAMLLGNILFLTGDWHYSILTAGLAVTPGPLVVAATAGFAGKVASRVGFRPVLLFGAVLLVGGLAWYALRVGARPDYVGAWLPATLIAGLGIGCTFPVLGAAAVSSLHPDRYSVGSAVNQTARQVGGSIGVAILVVLLGSANAAPDLGSFRHLWWFAAIAVAVSGAMSTLLRTPRTAVAVVEAVPA